MYVERTNESKNRNCKTLLQKLNQINRKRRNLDERQNVLDKMKRKMKRENVWSSTVKGSLSKKKKKKNTHTHTPLYN